MDLLSHSDGDSHEEVPAKKSNSAAYEMIPLQPGFEPTDLDVICARGKEGAWFLVAEMLVQVCACHCTVVGVISGTCLIFLYLLFSFILSLQLTTTQGKLFVALYCYLTTLPS